MKYELNCAHSHGQAFGAWRLGCSCLAGTIPIATCHKKSAHANLKTKNSMSVMPPCAGHCCGHCCDHPCGHWCCCHCCCCCHTSCCWYAAPCWKASCFSLSAFSCFSFLPIILLNLLWPIAASLWTYSSSLFFGSPCFSCRSCSLCLIWALPEVRLLPCSSLLHLLSPPSSHFSSSHLPLVFHVEAHSFSSLSSPQPSHSSHPSCHPFSHPSSLQLFLAIGALLLLLLLLGDLGGEGLE